MWKPVHGYERTYEISDNGIVRRKAGFWCTHDRPLKMQKGRNGYIRVRLSNRSRDGRRFLVHRLVFMHFKGPIPVGMTVNHINGVKHDNRAENLELATMSEQMIHAYVTGLQRVRRGSDRGKVAKLQPCQVIEIRKIYAAGNHTYESLAKLYGVTGACIGTIVNRTRWRHIA